MGNVKVTNAETVCLLWQLAPLGEVGKNLLGVYSNRNTANQALQLSYPDSTWVSRGHELDLIVGKVPTRTFWMETVFVHQVPEKL